MGMLGIDVKICTFINGWSGPIRQIGKTILANSKFEEKVADLKAEIRSMLRAFAPASFKQAQLRLYA